MSEPYSPGMISRALRSMSLPTLRAVHPHKFHTHPVRKIVPSRMIRELISNEIASRGDL